MYYRVFINFNEKGEYILVGNEMELTQIVMIKLYDNILPFPKVKVRK